MKTIKILTLLLVLSFFACNKEDMVKIDNSEFVKVIEAGGVPERVEEKTVVKDSTVTKEEDDSSIWVCTTKKVSRMEANDEFPLFNPNASVIYPGSLLQGKTLSAASPSVIPVKRAGGTISIDVIDGNLQPSFTVDEVTKSKIAAAANSIISGSSGVVPANFDFTYKEVQSKEQLAIELGLNLETQFVEVESHFNFRKNKEYYRYLVKLNQSFYTMSFDIPTSVKDIFAPEVTPQELSKYVAAGNPATFISDVTYGRIYYMLIESSSSSTEIEAKLSASFSTATVGGGVDVNVNSLKSLNDLQIQVVALGGEAQSTFATIGEMQLSSLVQMLGASSDIRTGVPISYVVRSVADRQVVSVKLATEYDVKNCVALSTPLGSPIVWWDASVLLEDGDPHKPINSGGDLPARSECIATDGRYLYGGGGFNEHFVYYEDLRPGTVVKKWPDISGNKIHASSVSSDPNSRPLLVKNAFNSGMPAVEFFRGQLPSSFINNRLSYSGTIFNNKEYTIFAVISYPDQSTINVVAGTDSWTEYKTAVENDYGYFIRSDGYTTPLNTLKIGFNEFSKLSFSHGQTPLEIDKLKFYPFQQYKVYAFRFSKTEGMAVFQNGVKVTEGISSPGETGAIQSYTSALLCAPYNPDMVGYARIRIGEIKVYGKAATDAQIQRESSDISLKYGL